eukprot:365031-Chlamydomonas_euryale.AAC.4
MSRLTFVKEPSQCGGLPGQGRTPVQNEAPHIRQRATTTRWFARPRTPTSVSHLSSLSKDVAQGPVSQCVLNSAIDRLQSQRHTVVHVLHASARQ